MLGVAGILVQEVVHPDIWFYESNLPQNLPGPWKNVNMGKEGTLFAVEIVPDYSLHGANHVSTALMHAREHAFLRFCKHSCPVHCFNALFSSPRICLHAPTVHSHSHALQVPTCSASGALCATRNTACTPCTQLCMLRT